MKNSAREGSRFGMEELSDLVSRRVTEEGVESKKFGKPLSRGGMFILYGMGKGRFGAGKVVSSVER